MNSSVVGFRNLLTRAGAVVLIVLLSSIGAHAQWTSSGSNVYLSTSTMKVGIGTATPAAPLHVYDGVNRDYQINRIIPGTTASSGLYYVLLHTAYAGTIITENYVMGRISGRRGGTGEWNRKISVEVNTASAYASNRGSIVSYNEPVRLVKLTYSSASYLALEISAQSTLYHFTFTGYSKNETLTIAADSEVSNVEAFTASDPVTFTENVSVVTHATVSGKPAPVLSLSAPSFAYDNLSGPAIQFSSFINLGKISGIDERSSGTDTRRGGLAFHTILGTGGTDGGYYERMRIDADGFVGIGTNDPKAKLHVSNGYMLMDVSSPILYTGIASTDQNRYLSLVNSPNTPTINSGLKAGGVLVANDYTYANPGENDLVVKGSVSIGSNVSTGQYKLAVEGKIVAREVTVTTETAWPDYVFSERYTLLPFHELQNYIRQHRHLPDVPSAEEIEKQGIQLGEMNAILLKKIEELTLYVLELKKENEEQAAAIEALKKQ